MNKMLDLSLASKRDLESIGVAQLVILTKNDIAHKIHEYFYRFN